LILSLMLFLGLSIFKRKLEKWILPVGFNRQTHHVYADTMIDSAVLLTALRQLSQKFIDVDVSDTKRPVDVLVNNLRQTYQATHGENSKRSTGRPVAVYYTNL